MTEDSQPSTEQSRRGYSGKAIFIPGQPVRIVEEAEADSTQERKPSPLLRAMASTFKAYRKAATSLLDGQFAGVREFAPPQLRVPCHIYVVSCLDGVLVRYDAAGDEEPKAISASTQQKMMEVSPLWSEQVVHTPEDPSNYQPGDGPQIRLWVRGPQGEEADLLRAGVRVFASPRLPENFEISPPPMKPPCLASVNREFYLNIQGVIESPDAPAGALKHGADHFLAHTHFSLPVGWQAIEIYPLVGEEYWRPEYAPVWAQQDLSTVLIQRNLLQSNLQRLDSRRVSRERYARLLEEFEALLSGAEEPCHQFLKAQPHLLCPTHDAAWSKLVFGNHVSDFVFREPLNDYLLVEIEAPHRRLFRKDGHPRQSLNHAIAQVRDWTTYIQDNKQKVEEELGLANISATPRTLVVIGRSEALTEENRRALTALQSTTPRLTILTYDELLARARANLEHHFGPMALKTEDFQVYYYRVD